MYVIKQAIEHNGFECLREPSTDFTLCLYRFRPVDSSLIAPHLATWMISYDLTLAAANFLSENLTFKPNLFSRELCKAFCPYWKRKASCLNFGNLIINGQILFWCGQYCCHFSLWILLPIWTVRNLVFKMFDSFKDPSSRNICLNHCDSRHNVFLNNQCTVRHCFILLSCILLSFSEVETAQDYRMISRDILLTPLWQHCSKMFLL